MTDKQKQSPPTFGFLTVFEDPVVGLVGGYLIVNHRGRPSEFHCTAPVESTRADEILFGPTLRPHLFCERIGAALLAKAKAQPQLVVVNQLECWQLADETSLPVVLVDPKSKAGRGENGEGMSAPADYSSTAAGSEEARTAQACLDQVAPAFQEIVRKQLQELVRYVDLSEPFERITEAIREASGVNDRDANRPSESADSVSHNAEGPHDQAA